MCTLLLYSVIDAVDFEFPFVNRGCVVIVGDALVRRLELHPRRCLAAWCPPPVVPAVRRRCVPVSCCVVGVGCSLGSMQQRPAPHPSSCRPGGCNSTRRRDLDRWLAYRCCRQWLVLVALH